METKQKENEGEDSRWSFSVRIPVCRAAAIDVPVNRRRERGGREERGEGRTIRAYRRDMTPTFTSRLSHRILVWSGERGVAGQGERLRGGGGGSCV